MGILRSETMKRGTLVLPADRAKHVLERIGKSVQIQFEDMNEVSMVRHYRKHIQRIEELERRLRFMEEELQQYLRKHGDADQDHNISHVEGFLEHCSELMKLESLSSEVASLYKQFVSFRDNNSVMIEQRNGAIEEKFVAIAATSRQLRSGGVFSIIAGVMPRSEQERFSRTIFRASRGNALAEFFQIPDVLWDESSKAFVPKSVFVVYHQGTALSEKFSKLAVSFRGKLYPWPESESAAAEQIRQSEQLMADKAHTLAAYDKFLADEYVYLYRVLGGEVPLIEAWKLFCAKEKGVYAVLNCFEGESTLRADCWFPAVEEGAIKQLLYEIGGGGPMLLVDGVGGETEGHHATPTCPPTYIRRNEITYSFQEIVDTYGVPRYKEVNPAIFSVVSFPFLFGIMFGDFGHGMILVMFGLWLGFQSERNLEKSGLGVLGPHKWMFFSMGVFSAYAGLIYSEFFGIGLNLFGSRWSCLDAPSAYIECTPLYDPTNSVGPGPYPFGLDPAWDVASNQLVFVNSMKMKIAVLFGVLQMLLGLGLKVLNAVHFRSVLDLVFECVPQIVFLISFFGYMDFLIMLKWVTPYEAPPGGLIDAIIKMMLGGGEVAGVPLYENQLAVQHLLLFLIFAAVPIILIPKPAFLWFQNYRQTRTRSGSHLPEDQQGLIGSRSDHHAGEPFSISEIAIHQAIETIEFVLGTVSHTASYLRLWALSLAHQQLSKVFLEKILFNGMTNEWMWLLNGIPVYVSFAVFIGVTAGILLGMDVMECFLHTLRLHWVEFQSKFYKGDGIGFKPYKLMGAVSEDPQ